MDDRRLPYKRISTGALLIVLVVILGLFIQTSIIAQRDYWVLGEFIERRNDPRTEFLIAITNVFSPMGTIVLGAVSSAVLWAVTRSWRPAAYIAGCVAGSSAITHLLKPLYRRPRPAVEHRLVFETNYSFPSGHATGTAALMCALAVVLSLLFVRLWQRAVIWASAATVTALICLSRLYLGVHYFSDVAAGCLVGVGVCLLLYVLVRHRLGRDAEQARRSRERARAAELGSEAGLSGDGSSGGDEASSGAEASSGDGHLHLPFAPDTSAIDTVIPPEHRRRERILQLVFYISLIGKGLFGIVQMAAGLIVLFVPKDAWHRLAQAITRGTLEADPHQPWASALLRLTERLDTGLQMYAAIYMISHAATKIVLVWAVLKGKMWAYPWMMGFLALFIVYQTYEMFARHSVFFFALTVFDIFIMWLTRHEWKIQKRKLELSRAKAAADSGAADS